MPTPFDQLIADQLIAQQALAMPIRDQRAAQVKQHDQQLHKRVHAEIQQQPHQDDQPQDDQQASKRRLTEAISAFLQEQNNEVIAQQQIKSTQAKEEYNKQIEELKLKVTQASQANEAADKHIEELKLQASQANEESNKRIEELKLQASQANEESNKRIEELKLQASQANEANQAADKRIEELKLQASQATQQAKEESKKHIGGLQGDITRLKQDLADANDSLVKTNALHTQALDKLKQDLVDANETLAKTNASNALHTQTIDKLKQAVEAQQDKTEALHRQDIDQHQLALDKLKKEADQAKKRIGELKLQATQSTQAKEESDKRHEKDLSETRASQQEATEAKAKLQQTLDKRNLELESIAKKIKTANAAYGRATLKNEALMSEIQEYKDTPQAQLTSSNEALLADNAASLQAKDVQILALQNQVDNLNARIHQLQTPPPPMPYTTRRPVMSCADLLCSTAPMQQSGVWGPAPVLRNQTQGYQGGATAVQQYQPLGAQQQQSNGGYSAVHSRQQHIQPVFIVPPQSGQLNQRGGNEWRHDQPLGPQPQGVRPGFAGAGEGFLAQVGGDGELPLHNPTDAARLGGANYNAAAPPQVSAGVPQGGQVAREDDENGEVDDEEDENLLGDADRDATHPNGGNVWDAPSTPAQFLRQDDDDENT